MNNFQVDAVLCRHSLTYKFAVSSEHRLFQQDVRIRTCSRAHFDEDNSALIKSNDIDITAQNTFGELLFDIPVFEDNEQLLAHLEGQLFCEWPPKVLL